MIIDSDGHFFETEEIFDKCMEPALRNYRPRLLGDEQGHNFWVVDGQTSYKRPTIKGAGAPGTAAPPGKALQSARRASPGSQTLTNLKERLDDLDRENIDLQFIYPSFLLHANSWPDGVEEFQPNIVTEVYTADGKVLGTFAIERRVIIGFKDIPPVYRNAVVAVEDAEFWKHLGINLWRIPATAWENARSGRKAGASTLTMQLSRLLFLTPEKTYERKVKEVILAFQIEKNFTKEEIFTFYCNQVYFGHGQYGVEAASQFYFSKSARDLTLTEAAMLAGLPQSPSRLSPISPDRVKQRRNHVLQRMLDEKYITAEEAEKAKAAELGLHVRRPPPSIAPYFLEEVRKYLEKEYGSQRIYQGGLRVYTTLDSGMQLLANRALRLKTCGAL